MNASGVTASLPLDGNLQESFRLPRYPSIQIQLSISPSSSVKLKVNAILQVFNDNNNEFLD